MKKVVEVRERSDGPGDPLIGYFSGSWAQVAQYLLDNGVSEGYGFIFRDLEIKDLEGYQTPFIQSVSRKQYDTVEITLVPSAKEKIARIKALTKASKYLNEGELKALGLK